MTSFSYADPSMPLLQRGLVRTVEVLTGQPLLARLYRDYQRTGAPIEDFWTGSVRRLALDIRYDEAALQQLPATGPVVVVANHPYGVLDGIVLGWLANRIRPDFKILTNAVLYRAPEVRPWLLPIDFAGTEQAMSTNLASRKAAHAQLAAGGASRAQPASTRQRVGKGATEAAAGSWRCRLAGGTASTPSDAAMMIATRILNQTRRR